MKRIDVMYKELRGLSTLVKDHQVATEQINFLYDDLERARSLMYFSLIFGCLLSGYGFYNWRNTTQKIEDMQQAIEVIDAHNKIKNELS